MKANSPRQVFLALLSVAGLVMVSMAGAMADATVRPGLAAASSATSIQADTSSDSPSISANGRYIVFTSSAANLVGGDTNGTTDVFLRDLANQVTRRISVNSNGVQANGASVEPSISADGRYIAFDSEASNLVAGDTNGASDVFIRDMTNHVTRRLSVTSSGAQSKGVSFDPSISADGRYVAFDSSAVNLVNGDTNGSTDVFVRDRTNAVTRLISVSSSGVQASTGAVGPSISADGRYVAFRSDASNLVNGDTNPYFDVFVRDQINKSTKRVSISSTGTEGNSDSFAPSISADGRFVAFTSDASNLVADDTNFAFDVLVRDRTNQITSRVSVGAAGVQGNSDSYASAVSADGNFVAYQSVATNLVNDDTNGVNDIFVWSMVAQTTVRQSLSSGGLEGDGASSEPSLSSDGSKLAFTSDAANLVPSDTNGSSDIFVRVTSNQVTKRASVG
jgi:Tol biopolymer transport system component